MAINHLVFLGITLSIFEHPASTCKYLMWIIYQIWITAAFAETRLTVNFFTPPPSELPTSLCTALYLTFSNFEHPASIFKSNVNNIPNLNHSCICRNPSHGQAPSTSHLDKDPVCIPVKKQKSKLKGLFLSTNKSVHIYLYRKL